MLMDGREPPDRSRDTVWELFCTILLTILKAEIVQLARACRDARLDEGKNLVPPTRIERATRGLGIAANPTSDNLNPQEAIRHDINEVGTDGAGLSCPGSSMVADLDSDNQTESFPGGRKIPTGPVFALTR